MLTCAATHPESKHMRYIHVHELPCWALLATWMRNFLQSSQSSQGTGPRGRRAGGQTQAMSRIDTGSKASASTVGWWCLCLFACRPASSMHSSIAEQGSPSSFPTEQLGSTCPQAKQPQADSDAGGSAQAASSEADAVGRQPCHCAGAGAPMCLQVGNLLYCNRMQCYSWRCHCHRWHVNSLDTM